MKIELKKWTLEDKEELIIIANNIDRKYLSNRIPNPYTEKDAIWYINMISEHEGIDGVWRCIVADGKIVGTISAEQNQDVYCIDAEIGYFLENGSSGNGIMTEAVNQFISIAFKELKIERLTGLVYEPNKASQKVLENNGFKLEGIKKKAVLKDNNIYNLYVYGKEK